jgi:hypothetical protein
MTAVSRGTSKPRRANPGICLCGRAPKRPGQSNCLACNALAQSIYRARKKNRAEEAHARKFAALAGRLAHASIETT